MEQRAISTEQLLKDLINYDRNLAKQYAEQEKAPEPQCIPLANGCTCGIGQGHQLLKLTAGMERNAAWTRRELIGRGLHRLAEAQV